MVFIWAAESVLDFNHTIFAANDSETFPIFLRNMSTQDFFSLGFQNHSGVIPSGKRLHNYGKKTSLSLMSKSKKIYGNVPYSFLYVYQRVFDTGKPDLECLEMGYTYVYLQLLPFNRENDD